MPKVLGTTHRGKVEVTSEKQMGYLHAHHIDHTHFSKDGKTSRHIYPKPINTGKSSLSRVRNR